MTLFLHDPLNTVFAAVGIMVYDFGISTFWYLMFWHLAKYFWQKNMKLTDVP